MYHLFGNKRKIAFAINVVKVLPEQGIVWGGFEMWLNDVCFGDINLVDIISGNYYSMVLKLKEKNEPCWDALSFNKLVDIYNLIYKNFTGEALEADNKTLLQSALHDSIWERFVLSPNGTMEFDQTFIFYYSEGENKVRFIYKLPEESQIDIRDVVLDELDIDNVVLDFNNCFENLISRDDKSLAG